jgi:hypothetical protein
MTSHVRSEGGRDDLVRWNDENAYLAKAEDIQQSRPQWMVWWGVCSRVYWGIPLFDMTTRLHIYSPDPDDLIERMDRAEERFRCPKGRR